MSVDTHIAGTRPEYMLEVKGAVAQVMTRSAASNLNQSLAMATGTVLVREVAYGPWYPFGSPEAQLACTVQHDATACTRCGFEPS